MATVTFEVRPFVDRDSESVAALWEEVFSQDPGYNQPPDVIARKRSVQSELFLVSDRAGVVVGTVLGGYDGVRSWVYHLAVAPDERRQGLGRRMIEEMEIRLRALGAPKLNLQVRAGNEAVVRFYEKLGYEVEPRVSMGKVLRTQVDPS